MNAPFVPTSFSEKVAFVSDHYRVLSQTDKSTIQLALKSAKEILQSELDRLYPLGGHPLERPATNYSKMNQKPPYVPWVMAGFDVQNLRRGWTPKDIYMLKSPIGLRDGTKIVGATLYANIQWSNDGQDIYITLLPYAWHWHQNRTLKRLNIDWSVLFKQVKDEVRQAPAITRLKGRGFMFDDNIDLGRGVEPEKYLKSRGYQMQRSYVVSKHYSRHNIPDEVTLIGDMKALMDVYSAITTSWPRVDTPRRDIEDEAIVFEF